MSRSTPARPADLAETAPTAAEAPASSRRGRRFAWWTALAVGVGVLFAGYLRMARSTAMNADGASNALQAWDMLHGNVLLRGWTVSDVPFYTTELIQHALVELVRGLHADVVHIAAAISYTLLVILVALLARGRASGVEALARMGVAVAIVLAPSPGIGVLTMLSSPNHTGSGVPLLLTWLVLDQALAHPDGRLRRWLPVAIAALLAWGQGGDPLVTFVAVVPLVAVCGWRIIRGRGPWRQRLLGLDGQLIAAGIASTLLAHALLAAVKLAGGFHVHGVAVLLAPPDRLAHRVQVTATNTAVVFGAYLPVRDTPIEVVFGVVGALAMVVALATVAVTVVGALRQRGNRDLVSDILAVSVVVNLAAYLVSTLPDDKGGSREIIALLPLGAALVGRVFVGRFLAPRVPVGRLVQVAVALLVVASGAFVSRAAAPSAPAEAQDAADWLVAHRQTYGIGSYWAANSITLTTGGRVQVAPVIGQDTIVGYRWESRADWYDPTHHDARFLVLDLRSGVYGTVETAVRQFGQPVARHDFGDQAILVYDHNLLVGLAADCGKPTMAECLKD
jgi:hypothetical protein